jgi:hypothetical protein
MWKNKYVRDLQKNQHFLQLKLRKCLLYLSSEYLISPSCIYKPKY